MTIIRTEADGTVTANWGGHEIRDARRGFWNKGERCWNRPEFPAVQVVPTEEACRMGSVTANRHRADTAAHRRIGL